MSQITVFYDHIRNAAIQNHLSIEEIAPKLTAWGISGVEIEYQELIGSNGTALSKKLSSLGLPISCVYCIFHWESDENSINYQDVICRLNELGISNLLAIPGFTDEDKYSSPAKDADISQKHLTYMKDFLPKLASLCRDAQKYHIQVLMEDFDFYAAPFGTGAELQWFFQQLPNLGCAFDTGNFMYFGEDSLEVLPKLLKYIRYVHCKDRSLTPVSGEDYLTTMDGKDMYSSPVGSGVIKIREIIDMILKSGYDGTFAIEHFGSHDQLGYMKESAAYISRRLNLQQRP